MGGIGSGRHKTGANGKQKFHKNGFVKVNYNSPAFKSTARKQMREGIIPKRKL